MKIAVPRSRGVGVAALLGVFAAAVVVALVRRGLVGGLLGAVRGRRDGASEDRPGE